MRKKLHTTDYLGNLRLEKIYQSLIAFLNQGIPVVVICSERLITKALEVIDEKKGLCNLKSAFHSVHLEKGDRAVGFSPCLPTVANSDFRIKFC